MVHRRCSTKILAGLFVLQLVGVGFGVGMDAQRIVVRRGIAVLPSEILPFFTSRAADIEEHVLEPDGVWRREHKLRGRANWDYLWLDIKATDGSVSARMAAAEAFPRQEREAKQLFKSLGFKDQGGKLPWAIEELHAELVRAFEQKDEDEIIKAAGHLAHFAWAASQPFNVTMNRSGQDTNNLHLGELEIGDPFFPHQSVEYRIMWELVRRNRNRYGEHVRIRPIELQPITGPLEPCFRSMVGSLARLDDLLTADRRISEQLNATDGDSLVKREDEFYQLLDARCGEIVVDRLRSGALLTANLIVGAWQRAGRPVIGKTPALHGAGVSGPRVNPSQTPRQQPQADTTGGKTDKVQYVGSKNSKVFHRSDCPHAKRISPKNLVHYKSAEDARRQGKRPCRACKPE